jgi:hypothetical protein
MALSFAVTDGQLPNAKATLYTETQNGVILGITLTAVAATTASIYLNRSGTSRAIVLNHNLALNDTWDYTVRHALQAGDLIEGVAGAAASVDYLISVIRRP